MSTYSSPVEIVYDTCCFLHLQQIEYPDSPVFKLYVKLYGVVRSPKSGLVIVGVKHTLR